ncbi:MAG: type pilus assembly protein PilM [Betaproteobacteria bacterium]|nr:type pilus assembly protein PilM [Betaproteobacteria bacterium]
MNFNLEILDRLFKSKAPALIGCDISSSSVKLVEIVDKGKNVYCVERYVIEPLPRDAVVDGNINNLEAVSDCLKRGWKRMGTNIKGLALALPSAAVITKKITVPAGQLDSELELQVETEANQYIPFALDEVNLDFQVIGPAPNSPDDVEVLIAASRKEKIEDRVAAAEAAGLKAMVVDIESFAVQTAFELIERALPDGGKDQNIAIVDVGTTMMNLNVLRNGQSIYMREQPFGGNTLTQEIQRAFGMSPEEAEASKRTGGLPDNYDAEVLAPFMDTLGLEVARALQFFFTSTQFNQVNHILLAGGCAAIPGIDEVVTRRTSVPSMVANPFANMALSSKIRPKNLATDAPSLMVACGLAMRRFDA